MNSTSSRFGAQLRRLSLLALVTTAAVAVLPGAASADSDSVAINSPSSGEQVSVYGGSTTFPGDAPLTVTFTATGTPATCALDAQVPIPCSSPVTFPHVTTGAHTVTVTAGTAVATTSFDVLIYLLGTPPDPPIARPVVTARWRVAGARTWLRELGLRALGQGAQVTLSCRGTGCPSRHSTTRLVDGSVDLSGFLRGHALHPGTRITVRVASRRLGRATSTYTVRRSRHPLSATSAIQQRVAPAGEVARPSVDATTPPFMFHGTDLVITSVASHVGVCSVSDGPRQVGGCRAGRLQQGTGQSITQLIGDATGSKAVSRIGIRNVEPHARRITLEGAGSTRGYRVRYFAGKDDVTRRVVAGTFRTPRIKPGGVSHLRLVVTTRRFVRNGKDTGFSIRAKQRAVTTSAGTEIMPGDSVTDVVESFPYDAIPVLVQPSA